MTAFFWIPSMFRLLSVAILLPSCTICSAQSDADYNDPTFLGRNQIFSIPTNAGANFTCGTPGDRCVYRTPHYANVNNRRGQTTRTTDGADTWGAITPVQDYLVLNRCTEDSDCTASCTANCTCIYTDDDDGDSANMPCLQVVSYAPTPPPPTPAPIPTVCTTESHIEHCAALMQRVPPNNFFDCYNFCGGIFVSSCSFDGGQCGRLECDNATEVGTIDGLVTGCKDSRDAPDRFKQGGFGAGPSEPAVNNGDGTKSGVGSRRREKMAVAGGLFWLASLSMLLW